LLHLAYSLMQDAACSFYRVLVLYHCIDNSAELKVTCVVLLPAPYTHDLVFYFCLMQLYMETVQDLLAPERDNISIQEDPKTGDVSVPGATQVLLQDQTSFVRLLDVGEANRFAANTKLNTESSRSHALLLVSKENGFCYVAVLCKVVTSSCAW
jgi:hypothetical protein